MPKTEKKYGIMSKTFIFGQTNIRPASAMNDGRTVDITKSSFKINEQLLKVSQKTLPRGWHPPPTPPPPALPCTSEG